MDRTQKVLLEALASAIRGEGLENSASDQIDWNALFRLAQMHSVLPMVVQTAWDNPELWGKPGIMDPRRSVAKKAVIRQARRTGEFILLYQYLRDRGLKPLVLKGIVCRELYPVPDQRSSVDEDLLIDPEEYPALHDALTLYGLKRMGPETAGAYEMEYRDREKDLYIEVHKLPFAPDSEAVRQMNEIFGCALTRTVEINIYGVSVRTLCPTDHLLYLLCHAYKHLIYSGFGIRQVCDICLFARKYAGEIDWRHVAEVCRRRRIDTLAAAVFRIGSEHLGIPAPEAFAGISVDELPLLEDILTGGLYGVSDENRLHSSNITLGAVEAARKGRRPSGFWRSVFPPREYLENRFPYVKSHPVLLPAAWGQRVFNYLTDRKTGKKVKPAESIRIAAERIQLLRQYGVID